MILILYAIAFLGALGALIYGDIVTGLAGVSAFALAWVMGRRDGR
ncbi:hypothetical protein [Stenotrophomonas sp.]